MERAASRLPSANTPAAPAAAGSRTTRGALRTALQRSSASRGSLGQAGAARQRPADVVQPTDIAPDQSCRGRSPVAAQLARPGIGVQRVQPRRVDGQGRVVDQRLQHAGLAGEDFQREVAGHGDLAQGLAAALGQSLGAAPARARRGGDFSGPAVRGHGFADPRPGSEGAGSIARLSHRAPGTPVPAGGHEKSPERRTIRALLPPPRRAVRIIVKKRYAGARCSAKREAGTGSRHVACTEVPRDLAGGVASGSPCDPPRGCGTAHQVQPGQRAAVISCPSSGRARTAGPARARRGKCRPHEAEAALQVKRRKAPHGQARWRGSWGPPHHGIDHQLRHGFPVRVPTAVHVRMDVLAEQARDMGPGRRQAVVCEGRGITSSTIGAPRPAGVVLLSISHRNTPVRNKRSDGPTRIPLGGAAAAPCQGPRRIRKLRQRHVHAEGARAAAVACDALRGVAIQVFARHQARVQQPGVEVAREHARAQFAPVGQGHAHRAPTFHQHLADFGPGLDGDAARGAFGRHGHVIAPCRRWCPHAPDRPLTREDWCSARSRAGV